MANDQLWDCFCEDMARAVYSAVKNNVYKEMLISGIKKLAVCAQNELVNVVTFLRTTLDRDVTIGSFDAGLRGQVAVCNFEIECPLSTCNNTTWTRWWPTRE